MYASSAHYVIKQYANAFDTGAESYKYLHPKVWAFKHINHNAVNTITTTEHNRTERRNKSLELVTSTFLMV